MRFNKRGFQDVLLAVEQVLCDSKSQRLTLVCLFGSVIWVSIHDLASFYHP